MSAPTDVFVRPGGANNEILSLSLDTPNQKLYFVDDSEGSFGTAPSVTNEVEVLNLANNAVTTLATLPSGSHYFDANGTGARRINEPFPAVNWSVEPAKGSPLPR